MKKNTKKIVFINNIVAPYRIPLFNKLNDEFSRRGVLFEVVFLSENESVRDWKVKYSEITFKYEILPVLYQRRNNRTTTSDFILNSGFFRYLFYDYVVMFGYNYPTYLMISIFRRLTGRETILFSESTIGDKLRSVLLHGLKKKLVKNIYSKFIVPGAEAKMFICGYGIDKTKVRIAENAVIPLGAMAKKTNSNKDIVIIFVGRLSREKNVEFLIKNIPKTTGFNFKLIIVGDGPEESALKAIKTTSIVEFKGYLQGIELVKIFNSADILALPSISESWGLVVNEAIHFGVVPIVSDRVGCRHELVADNGEIFKLNDSIDFKNKLMRVCEKIEYYRNKSKETSKKITINAQADKFVEFILDE